MKTKKRSRNQTAWTAAQHSMRADRLTKTERQAHRTAVLSHDTLGKRSSMKLQLHLTKIQRQVVQMKDRLQKWDEQEEAQKEAQKTAQEEPPKKKGRKGPETWKLKGAARPAWKVYDFDTRYVDPHVQAHEQAKVKAQRCQNLLAVYKGQLASPQAPPIGREYLSLLMQWGHLSLESKHYKTARAAWLECIELEGNDHIITTARDDLMRLYLQLQRYEAVLRLGKELDADTSVWIRFSVAWVAVELGKENAQELLVRAIKSNPFCAYYLAFKNSFASVFEYLEDIEQAPDEPQSSLEEALEYCVSDFAKSWQENGAALELRRLLVNALQGHGPLSHEDIEWKETLTKIENEFESRMVDSGDEQGGEKGDDSQSNVAQKGGDEDQLPLDVKMYAGMFRTAMEMLEESGQLDQTPKETRKI